MYTHDVTARRARRSFLHAAVAAPLVGLAAPPVTSTRQASPAFSGARLYSLPRRVFKAPAPKEDFESWTFNLMLESTSSDGIDAAKLTLTLLAGGAPVSTEVVSGPGLHAWRWFDRAVRARTTRDAAGSTFWNAVFRIRQAAPVAAKIDACDAELAYDAGGVRHVVRGYVALRSYTPAARLHFPFVGNGIITQGGTASWGHMNRSGQFAVDAVALNEFSSPMIAPWGPNSALAGWGRPILAPAPGVVVVARGDRPDQPRPGTSDPRYYVKEYPQGGDPGNHVVIDHGNSEFSMIAHLQEKSVRVTPGQRVSSREPIGLLGNSGDSTSPHLHYQLQDGPDWEFADALPSVFEGLRRVLVPGWYFSAPG